MCGGTHTVHRGAHTQYTGGAHTQYTGGDMRITVCRGGDINKFE